jgi:hypothetical protein
MPDNETTDESASGSNRFVPSGISYSVGGYRNAPGTSANVPNATTIDPTAVSQAASELGFLGSQLSEQTNTLQSSLESYNQGGYPWGGVDGIAISFGQSYQPACTALLGALNQLAQAIIGTSDTLAGVVQGFQQNEQNNQQLMN